MDRETFARLEVAIGASIEHIINKGSDDIFRPPVFSSSIEHDVINGNIEDFRQRAFSETVSFLKQANLERGRIGPIVNSLVAKDERSFRQVSWIDPFDAIKYLSLCNILFQQIEAARLPKDKGIIHSHRRSDDPG